MRICRHFLVIFLLCLWRTSALPNLIRIGGIFDPDDEILELAFRYAVDMVNKDRDIFPRSKLIARIEYPPLDDSFHASKKVCNLLQMGVAAIFGPQSDGTANHIQSICDVMEIPHIETRWDYKLKRDAYSINLYPYPRSLSQAYYDTIKALGWKSFVVLYDRSEGLVRLQTLLKVKEWSVTIRQLYPGNDWRPLLKEIKKSQETKFVIDVADKILPEVLNQALQIGLMGQYFSYFITSLDMHLIDIENFRYGGTNITALRLINPNQPDIQKVIEDWKYGELRYWRLRKKFDQITTEAALMYDAVRLFTKALKDLHRSSDVDITPLYCEREQPWPHGGSLMNYMKWYGTKPKLQDDLMSLPYSSDHYFENRAGSMYGERNMNIPDFVYSDLSRGSIDDPLVNHSMHGSYFSSIQVEGLTGIIKFNTDGFRTDFELEITELDSEEGMKKVGKWTPDGKANYTRTVMEASKTIAKSLQNRTLIVTTAVTAPYTMLKATSEQLKGNDRFEGFCIDIIENVAQILKFNYTFELIEDGAYGSKTKETGEWNGMIRALLDHKADLAIVDFTITYEREEAVDFSMPFMNLGIGIIYKKPQKKAPSLFSFMSPFSIDVWIYMATAYLGVSVLLFILARMSPREWDSPYPCIQEPEELENSFTLQNSLWFIIGTFLCQGADIAPRAVSTRIVAGIWWFFTLIMISSYTANLAAFLTVERMESPIEGAEDLAKQTKIKYGCKEKGSTYGFFAENKIPTYQRMWSAMSNARPTVFTPSNEDGVERVSNSNGMYAFLMESSSIEYVVQRRCDLMQVGGLLDSKSYGIALPQGSPYTGAISEAILKLKERGTIHELKTKWWERRKGGGRCQKEKTKDAAAAAELGLDNVGGVFVVMAGGGAVACILACCEFTWKARKLAAQEGDSFLDELWLELKFIARCGENEKPVRKPKSSETDSSTFYSSSNNYGGFDKK